MSSVHALPAPPIHDEPSLVCPLCEYSLYGLIDPRCPECGYSFEWDELRDRTRNTHPFLFEHHPRHNLWSFVHTFFAGLRPRKFWAGFYPTHTIVRRRLLWYAAVLGALICVVGLPPLVRAIWNVDASMRTARATGTTRMRPVDRDAIVGQYGSIEAWMDLAYPLFPSMYYLGVVRYDPAAAVMVFALGWPILTFGALMIFRVSMRRARIIPDHVLRCVIYSGDVVVLLTPLAIVMAYFERWTAGAGPWAWTAGRVSMAPGGSPLLVLAIVVLAYRLAVAYRKYLRFDHAVATILASQLIVALIVWVLWLNV